MIAEWHDLIVATCCSWIRDLIINQVRSNVHHVVRLTVQVSEVPEVVVSTLSLRHFGVRLRLAGMDEIRKLHAVLDKERGAVVANYIPITFLSVELDSKASDISDRVGRSSRAEDGAEADEDGSLSGRVGEHSSRRVFLQALVHLKGSERGSATGVDDSLWDSFMVEAVDLLASGVVLEELRADLVL